jgi:hypothetical protein
MKRTQLIVAVTAMWTAASLSTVHAADTGGAPPKAVGKVRTVYVEAARGLLIEKKLVGDRHPGARIAEVDMARNSIVPQAYVRLSGNDGTENGDLVTVRFDAGVSEGRLLMRDDAHFYETAHLAALKAKHDTLEAMMFSRHPLALLNAR